MKTWRGEGDFLTFLKEDPDIKKLLSPQEVEEKFDLSYHFSSVEAIFKRVFG